MNDFKDAVIKFLLGILPENEKKRNAVYRMLLGIIVLLLAIWVTSGLLAIFALTWLATPLFFTGLAGGVIGAITIIVGFVTYD